MNQFCLVGKVDRIPELTPNAPGWKTCTVTMEVERPFANQKGEFESDLIDIDVWRGAAETLVSCARLDSWITAKGRIQTRVREKNGHRYLNYSFIAEKIEYIH